MVPEETGPGRNARNRAAVQTRAVPGEEMMMKNLGAGGSRRENVSGVVPALSLETNRQAGMGPESRGKAGTQKEWASRAVLYPGAP